MQAGYQHRLKVPDPGHLTIGHWTLDNHTLMLIEVSDEKGFPATAVLQLLMETFTIAQNISTEMCFIFAK